ncbi:uncharacterized protein METZ01_LOCUS509603, partial [marine metagenome]
PFEGILVFPTVSSPSTVLLPSSIKCLLYVLGFPDRTNPGQPLFNLYLNLAKPRNDLFRLVSLNAHLFILLY